MAYASELFLAPSASATVGNPVALAAIIKHGIFDKNSKPAPFTDDDALYGIGITLSTGEVENWLYSTDSARDTDYTQLKTAATTWVAGA